MTESAAAAFWSYSHEDDRLDEGNITRLARRLANEYSLITGSELKLFVDRDIKWGEQWRERIDTALIGTTFFIPILTPRYFIRSECRKEVAAFHGKAEGAGLGELLMPILYTTVPEFSDDNADELVALLSRHQYEDWREHRVDGLDSPRARRAVHELAQRLADVATAVTTKQLDSEVATASGGESLEESGLYELADQINGRMPTWVEAIESQKIGAAQHDALWEMLGPRLKKLESGTGQGGARFALLQRLAQEDLPLAERELQAALTHNRLILELQPYVERAFTVLAAHPGDRDLLEPFWSALQFSQNELEERWSSLELDGYLPMATWWKSRAHLSRLARQVADTYGAALVRVDEGNEILQDWFDRRDRLFGQPTGGPPDASSGPPRR